MTKRLLLSFLSFLLLGTVSSASNKHIIAINRQNYYYAEQPSSLYLLQEERFTRLGFGEIAQDAFGQNGGYANLSVVPVSGLNVAVTPPANNEGAVYQMMVDDANTWGGGPVGPAATLSADATLILVPGIINPNTTAIGPLSVPTTSGQSQISLIECQITTSDTNSTAATFLSNGNPFQSFVNQYRSDTVSCQAKAGTASTSPTAPTVDLGYTAIGEVDVPYGTTTVSSSMIAPIPGGVNRIPAGAALTSSSSAINTTETVITTESLGASALNVGTSFDVRLMGTATASGTSPNSSTFNVRFGTTGTTSDPLIATFTLSASSAGTNNPFSVEIPFTVDTVGPNASISGYATVIDNGSTGIAAQGTSVIALTPSVFNSLVSAGILSISYKSNGTTITSMFQNGIITVLHQ